jgi:hypothetical protein
MQLGSARATRFRACNSPARPHHVALPGEKTAEPEELQGDISRCRCHMPSRLTCTPCAALAATSRCSAVLSRKTRRRLPSGSVARGCLRSSDEVGQSCYLPIENSMSVWLSSKPVLKVIGDAPGKCPELPRTGDVPNVCSGNPSAAVVSTTSAGRAKKPIIILILILDHVHSLLDRDRTVGADVVGGATVPLCLRINMYPPRRRHIGRQDSRPDAAPIPGPGGHIDNFINVIRLTPRRA